MGWIRRTSEGAGKTDTSNDDENNHVSTYYFIFNKFKKWHCMKYNF